MIYLLFYCIGILSACMSERVLDSLELKLLTVVSYHIWVLGIELRPSRTTASPLNHKVF